MYTVGDLPSGLSGSCPNLCSAMQASRHRLLAVCPILLEHQGRSQVLARTCTITGGEPRPYALSVPPVPIPPRVRQLLDDVEATTALSVGIDVSESRKSAPVGVRHLEHDVLTLNRDADL